MRKPVIGLTLGDPTGIGAEIVARVLQEKLLPPEADVILIGDRRQLAQGEADIGAKLDVRVVPDVAAADFAAPGIPMLDLANMDPAAIPRGKVSPEAGRLTGETLQQAIRLGQAGQLDAITFAPLNKQALHGGGWRYLDEHKMFADLIGHQGYFSEMNVVEGQWMSRVTSHVSLRKALDLINPQSITDAIQLADRMMRRVGIAKPRIAVCALNPHGGEGGLFGTEEIDFIRPRSRRLPRPASIAPVPIRRTRSISRPSRGSSTAWSRCITTRARSRRSSRARQGRHRDGRAADGLHDAGPRHGA